MSLSAHKCTHIAGRHWAWSAPRQSLPSTTRPIKAPQHPSLLDHVELVPGHPTPRRCPLLCCKARPRPRAHRLPSHEIARQPPQLRVPQHQHHVFRRLRRLPRGHPGPGARCVSAQQPPFPVFTPHPPVAQHGPSLVHASENDDSAITSHGRGAESARGRACHLFTKGAHVKWTAQHHVCNRLSVLHSAKPHLAAVSLAPRDPDSKLCEGA